MVRWPRTAFSGHEVALRRRLRVFQPLVELFGRRQRPSKPAAERVPRDVPVSDAVGTDVAARPPSSAMALTSEVKTGRSYSTSTTVASHADTSPSRHQPARGHRHTAPRPCRKSGRAAALAESVPNRRSPQRPPAPSPIPTTSPCAGREAMKPNGSRSSGTQMPQHRPPPRHHRGHRNTLLTSATHRCCGACRNIRRSAAKLVYCPPNWRPLVHDQLPLHASRTSRHCPTSSAAALPPVRVDLPPTMRASQRFNAPSTTTIRGTT